MDGATFEREFAPLKKIKDYYPKYVLTMDDLPIGQYGMYRHYFEGVFGRLDVTAINFIRLQKLFNAKSKSGLSMGFIRLMRQTLNQFFKYAVKLHYILVNPIQDVTVPDNGKRYLTNEKIALSVKMRKEIF